MFTDIEIEYLSRQPIGRLATSQPDGTLQVNPVGFAVNTELGTIDIGGYRMQRSRKYRNVADNGRVALVVDDVVSTDPWRVRFLEVRGDAEAITEPTDSVYPMPGAIVRIRPKRIISLALDKRDLELEPHQVPAHARNV
jgi:pyridoxamine 5'-phosphate oxidase family protein